MDPPDAALPQQRTDEHGVQRHAAILRRVQEGGIDLLFLGDSLTRRWEEQPDLWNEFFGRYHAANFGVGSDGTQHLLWRLRHGELEGISPHVVVLLIGTNNLPTHTAAEIAAAILVILQEIRGRLPGTRVLLHAIMPRGPQRPEAGTEENPCFVDKIQEINGLLARLDDGISVRFLDVGRRLIGPDGEILPSLMPDGLHLVRAGYVAWAEALLPVLAEMLR